MYIMTTIQVVDVNNGEINTEEKTEEHESLNTVEEVNEELKPDIENTNEK